MIVAVSGGIGSGKSAVMSVLAKLGAEVLYCDKINAELLERSDYVNGLQKLFPSAVDNGTVNKQLLKTIIFNNEQERKKLNGYSHKAIFDEIIRRSKGKSKIFVEIPLLAESGKSDIFDKIWLVTAPAEVRIARVCARDGLDAEMTKKIIDSQSAEQDIASFADEIIVNDGTTFALRAKVETLYNEL